ncbi:UGSC family (seleno)protein [Nocardioides sp. zg-DK7169]|uniref:UGSC family (seleno)protein n=1 Tax=Nocardioides sp. zg-DK7169 TaxID=2736600 RepID=UPI0015561822|nr:UGSC family (seleno)protein [Nocardioides sp. zg-DK7169]NPC96045.1 hypothetical protein [Nocardioides sp. zg-DK7169]
MSAEATIQVHVPTLPESEVEQVPMAPRTAAEGALRLGLIDNGKPRARELLQMLAEELGTRLPIASVELISKPSAANPISDEEAVGLASRVDLAVAGLGDCGACTACSVHDALLMERHGVPATVLITDVFVSTVARFSAVLGTPGYHSLVVPHPVAVKPAETLRRLAAGVADAAVTQLGAPSPAYAG